MWTDIASKKARKLELEQRLILNYNSYGDGYNLAYYLCKEYDNGTGWARELVNLYNEGM